MPGGRVVVLSCGRVDVPLLACSRVVVQSRGGVVVAVWSWACGVIRSYCVVVVLLVVLLGGCVIGV
jgi:hypothetical protein